MVVVVIRYFSPTKARQRRWQTSTYAETKTQSWDAFKFPLANCLCNKHNNIGHQFELTGDKKSHRLADIFYASSILFIALFAFKLNKLFLITKGPPIYNHLWRLYQAGTLSQQSTVNRHQATVNSQQSKWIYFSYHLASLAPFS